MRCHRCSRDAILHQRYSGNHLCPDHFRLDLEARAKRAIRAGGGIESGDRIAVALSGGPASSSLLHLLSAHFGMRRDLSLVALTIGEGDGPCRDLGRIRGIAEGLGVEWHSTTFADEFRTSLDGNPVVWNGGSKTPRCSHLRCHALASLARREGATRLALGTSLDDGARAVLAHVLRGNASRLVHRGLSPDYGIPLLLPFTWIPEAELSLYARLNVEGYIRDGRPRDATGFESEAARFLGEFTGRHPSTPFILARLGEALSGLDGNSRGDPVHLAGCREACTGGCPARSIGDRVAGHG